MNQLKDLQTKTKTLENHVTENSLTLLEILSNITFFGNLKMERCKFAKNGQCERYFLTPDAANKIPIATKCRIKGCTMKSDHFHIELSNLGCALCPEKCE